MSFSIILYNIYDYYIFQSGIMRAIQKIDNIRGVYLKKNYGVFGLSHPVYPEILLGSAFQ